MYIVKIRDIEDQVRYWTAERWVDRQSEATRFVLEREAAAIARVWAVYDGIVKKVKR